MTSLPLKLVVFDLGGTVVDHGCMAPVIAIIEALKEVGIGIDQQTARGPMGLHKRDHIREVLRLADVAQQWNRQHGQQWDEDDVQRIYESLIPRQKEVALQHADVVPGVAECVQWLRQSGIPIAATTGYPREVAQPILDVIAEQGFHFDASVCADEVPAGRPAPWMIFRSMEKLGIYPPSSVVKVGDTVPDVQAAKHAGALAVGITETGSEFGLTSEQLSSLDSDEREKLHQAVEEKFLAAGADFVIHSPFELRSVLERLC
jgi:phosphonoacetaldehyde hydrolase